MSSKHFFEKKGPFPLNKIIKVIGCDKQLTNNIEINGFESLLNANSNDLTYLMCDLRHPQ